MEPMKNYNDIVVTYTSIYVCIIRYYLKFEKMPLDFEGGNILE